MDDVTRSQKLDITQWPFVFASSDAAQRISDQGQVITKAMANWSTELSSFVGHRMSRNSEVVGQMSKCEGIPDALAAQGQWVREAVEDYGRLMEANMKIIGSLMGAAEQTKVLPGTKPS
jgi:2-keto-4-pentenoate hydratase